MATMAAAVQCQKMSTAIALLMYRIFSKLLVFGVQPALNSDLSYYRCNGT